jgi:hypothetical protein
MLAMSVLLLLASCGRPAAPDECVLYAACAEDAGRPDAADIAAAYGPDGTCWSEPADAREACQRRCEAALALACVPADTSDFDDGPDTSDGEPPDTSESDTEDHEVPVDTGVEGSIDLTWDAEGVQIALSGFSTSGFDFGIAETIDRSNGWFGEDCLHGTLGYQECHVVSGLSGRLDSIFDELVNGQKELGDVQSGRTTLFEKSFDDGGRLTYVVTIDGGDCFVWGHDPWYYIGDRNFDSCSRIR